MIYCSDFVNVDIERLNRRIIIKKRLASLLFFSLMLWNSKPLMATNLLLINDHAHSLSQGHAASSRIIEEIIAERGITLTIMSHEQLMNIRAAPPSSRFNCPPCFEYFAEQNPQWIKAIASADIVLINGGGTLTSLRDPHRTLLYLAHISKTIFAKKIWAINLSIFPQEVAAPPAKPKTAIFYKHMFKAFDFIAVRDPYSARSCPESTIISTDCLPLYIQKHYVPSDRTDQPPTIVLTSSLVFQESQQALALLAALERLQKNGYRILLLRDPTAPCEERMAVWLKKRATFAYLEEEAPTIEAWLNAIKNASLTISGRFHHCLAALCLGTPLLTLSSNCPKIEALCQQYGKEAPLSLRDPQFSEKIGPSIDRALDQSSLSVLEKACEEALKNFQGLEAAVID